MERNMERNMILVFFDKSKQLVLFPRFFKDAYSLYKCKPCNIKEFKH